MAPKPGPPATVSDLRQWGVQPFTPADLTSTRSRWLVEFIQRDLDTMRAGERIDAMDDLDALLSLRDPRIEFPDDQPPADTFALMADVQARLREGVALIEAKQPWQPLEKPLQTVFVPQPDGTVARRYTGTYAAVMLAAAVDALIAAWPGLRRCEHAPCNRLFVVDHGRQRFHTKQCADLARYHRPPEKRKRNYTQETINASRRDQLRKKKGAKR